jgi:hypothetical protein
LTNPADRGQQRTPSNARSARLEAGLGPQDRPGATTEMTTLRNRFTDPLTVLNVPDADLCGGRIDYILVTGYVPTSYKQDCTANEPSDHPMVLAVIEAN